MSHFRKFLQIAKIDEEKQSVWGYASTPTLDSDDEVVTLEAIKAALPGYLEWGNIREMHKASAVGTAIEGDTHVDDKGLWLGARVVDPLAWQKVKEKVYKGFSIGGNIVRKKGKLIESLDLVEISLVDRPANPDCKIEVVKFHKGVPDAEVLLPINDNTKADLIKTMDIEELSDAEVVGAHKFFNRLFAMFKNKDHLLPVADGVTVLNPEGHSDHPDLGLIPAVPQNMPEPGAIGQKDKDSAPYGDVTYADPGYQSDGKKRYPIDTPKHIRSAWSYIHKPGNRTAYTAEQLGHIEHAISAAWKTHIDKEGPPAAASEKFAKMIEDDEGDLVSLYLDAGILEKGMGSVMDLSYAFDSIRRAQRDRIFEGKIEDDTEDLAIARRLGSVAEELSVIIADTARHEGSEAVTLSDIDDLRYRPHYPYSGDTITIELEPIEMTVSPEDMAKRAKSKAFHFGKAAHHMAECAKCNKAAQSHANALMALHKAHALGSKEAAATAKAAPDFPHEKALEHLHGVSSNVMKAHDHGEFCQGHLDLCVGEGLGPGDSGDGWAGSHHVDPKSVPAMTEGHVPGLNDGQGPAKTVEPTITKGEMEAREQAAFWKGQAEALGKLPAPRGGAVPLTFDTTKFNTPSGSTPAGKTAGEMLLEGVDVRGAADETGAARAAGKMIGNMIANSSIFGRNPITDPNFRGAAG